VVELCTCYGEPIDVVESGTAEVIAYVRRHADDHHADDG